MEPVDFPEANVVMKAPANWDAEKNGPCVDLKVERLVTGGYKSVWRPSQEDLHKIAAGHDIELVILSDRHPPVWVAVRD